MHIQEHPIIPDLRAYIKQICSMSCDEDVETQYIRVLPDTCVELFINYTSTPVAVIGNELYHRSIITSRMSRSTDVQMRKGTGCLAICFHPGMAYQFFHLPMHLLTDTITALSDVWAGGSRELEDKLAGASNNNERAEIVQKYLLRQLTSGKQDLQFVYSLRQAQLSGGVMAVSKLVNDACLSQRHLSRKFRQYVGLSPKEYLRVCRFIKSLEHLKKYPVLSLTEIAYESGYYDQAHFNRDYKTYTGNTPGEVLNAQHIFY